MKLIIFISGILLSAMILKVVEYISKIMTKNDEDEDERRRLY